jgi:hypothetical protein
VSSTTATGRPRETLPLPVRALIASAAGLSLVEAALRLARSGTLVREVPLVAEASWPALLAYERLRAPFAGRPMLTLLGGLAFLTLVVLGTRAALLFWHNQIVARVTGSFLAPQQMQFPQRKVDVLAEIARRPPGMLFVGLEARRRRLGWSWRPVYISQQQKTMHRHVLGKTGSGKTASVLWPAVLQDALDGKGILVIDAKGSDENIRVVKAIAQVAGRAEQLRVFALPAWNQPQLASHSYNMVHVRPRRPGDPGGDPIATADRVFAALTPELGDNGYFNTQARIMFDNLCRLLHGMVDERGHGLVFTLEDLAVCFKGIGALGTGWSRAFRHCCMNSIDRRAAEEIDSQLARLRNDVQKCFSGIVGALDKFRSPLVNAYDPDIVFEEVLEKNLIVYAQLPANLFPTQAKAIGRVLLLDVQQEGSLRQVFRQQRNQTPFSVNVDEFYTFADVHVVDSLNKLRDAHLEFTLAHQSIADLELVSREFATAVWDNTHGAKDILNQDNPELCEKLAKSVGTKQDVELTVRRQQGALMTMLTTGDASSRLVEAYRLHPNAIKSLARCGQGYLYNDEGIRPVAYGMLPSDLVADYSLTTKNQRDARGLRLYERFLDRQEPF